MAQTSAKRSRDENEVDDTPQEPKRVRAELLFDILDDEPEPDNTDLVSVMKSLEEEITLPAEGVAAADPEPKQPDLGFLLEASDDELGLPPAEGEVTSGDFTGGEETAVEVEEVGFGKIWELEDDIHLDFGLVSDMNGGGDDGGDVFDGGLFDFDGGACGIPAADFSDQTWQPEFLPAA